MESAWSNGKPAHRAIPPRWHPPLIDSVDAEPAPLRLLLGSGAY